MSAESTGLKPGDRVDRFTLLEHVGGGGQGDVWKAQDGLPPHALVALKLVGMREGTLSDPERARREARSLAHLTHPGLVRCTGLFEDLGRGLLVLVMDLVEGWPLSRFLDDARLERRHREAVLWQLAQVLAYLHAAGVIHRDLKPENVLLGSTFWEAPFAPGTVKLIDFGIAVAAGNPAPLTRQLTVLGTPAYLGPEALDPGTWGGGTGTSSSADLFAFGVLGWRLLFGCHPTGLPPSATAVDYAVAYRAAGKGQTPWPAARLDHPWADMLRTCLALAPAQRNLSAADLAARVSMGGSGGTSLQVTREAIPILSPKPPPPEPPGLRTAPAAPLSAAMSPLPVALSVPPGTMLPYVAPAPVSPPLPAAPPAVPTVPGQRFSQKGCLLLVVVALGIGVGGVGLVALLLALVAPPAKPVSQAQPARPAQATPKVPATAPTSRPTAPLGTAPPPSDACACDTSKTSRPCASHRESVPFGCRASLPSSSQWSLRLSYVGVRNDAGKVQDLAELAPQATVRLCLAGTSVCAQTTAAGARLPSCGRGTMLPVSISDLTGAGLDISVVDATGRLLGSARGARYNEIGVMAVCHGLIFGKGTFGPGAIESLGVFLDDP